MDKTKSPGIAVTSSLFQFYIIPQQYDRVLRRMQFIETVY